MSLLSYLFGGFELSLNFFSSIFSLVKYTKNRFKHSKHVSPIICIAFPFMGLVDHSYPKLIICQIFLPNQKPKPTNEEEHFIRREFQMRK